MSGTSAAAAANAHLMNQINPLYLYQLQMAQALGSKKSCKYFQERIKLLSKRNMAILIFFQNIFFFHLASSKNNMQNNMNLNDIQRFAELQRQYLLDLTSAQHQQQASSSSNRQNNWKP